MSNSNYNRALMFCIENGIVLEEYEMEQLEYLYEGANIDIVKVAWGAFKNFKSYSKQVNDLIDQKNYQAAEVALKKMKAANMDFEKQFNLIDASGVNSQTFGALASVGINALKSLFPLTTKLGQIGSSVKTAGKVTGQVAYYSAKATGTAMAPAAGQAGGKIVQKVAPKVATGLAKNAKVAGGMAKVAKPLAKVSKIAGKAALPITLITTAVETIWRTIKDFNQMKKDAKEGRMSDNNLFKSKIQQLFKTMDDQIDILDRYLKVCIQTDVGSQQQPAQQQQAQQPVQPTVQQQNQPVARKPVQQQPATA